MYRSRYIFTGPPYLVDGVFYIELDINNTTLDFIPDDLKTAACSDSGTVHLVICLPTTPADYWHSGSIYLIGDIAIVPNMVTLLVSAGDSIFDNMELVLNEQDLMMTELEDMKPRAAKYIAQRGYTCLSE